MQAICIHFVSEPFRDCFATMALIELLSPVIAGQHIPVQPPCPTGQRLARARKLLESTTLNSESIAEMCGYRSVESFRVAFAA